MLHLGLEVAGVEIIRFIFWEAVKVLGLVFLGLFSAKAVTGLATGRAWIKPLLYAVILVLAAVGAWNTGNDVAAEVYSWTCYHDLGRGDYAQGYTNALRAVSLRPANPRYWRALIQSKMRLMQLQSTLDDESSLRALGGGNLDEVDDYQFALCEFFLGQYDKVTATTSSLIGKNPSYAAPYVLQGMACTAEKKYPEAEKSYLTVLQRFPNHQAAVEGLARAYFLEGDRRRALAVLGETAKFPFPEPARERFEALKGLYDQ
jgi:tetratricopeptide (TPR) repeat protein